MSWEEACATLLALKVGAKLQKVTGPAETRRWEVRGVIEDDCVVVIRRWVSQRRGHTYAVEHPEAFQVGLFTVIPSRSGRKRPNPAKTSHGLTDRENPIFCEHANEVPQACPCVPDCYCKDHTCCYREAA